MFAFKFTLILSMLFLFSGCDNSGDMGFPSLFGPVSSLDPAGTTGTGSSPVSIIVLERDSGGLIAGVLIDIDNGYAQDLTPEPYSPEAGDDNGAHFDLPPGRHIVKASHSDYFGEKFLIRVPGDNQYVQFQLKLDSILKDEYEPNDNIDDSTALFRNYDYDSWGDVCQDNCDKMLINTASLHSNGDEDWYNFYMYSDEILYVQLTSIPDGTNYDVEVWDGSDRIVWSENPNNDDENILAFGPYATSSGNHYIRIFSNGQLTSNPNDSYVLHVEVTDSY